MKNTFGLSVSSLMLLVSLPAQANPKYAPATTRLVDSTDYVRKHSAPDFWSAIVHYQPQGENMCQTGSLATIFNALKVHQPLDSETKNITQKDIIEKMNDAEWVQAMKDKKCYSLDKFSDLVNRALKVYFGDSYSVRVVHVDSMSPVAIGTYLKDFSKNEKSDHDYIIANFDQAVFTGEAEEAGHVSPIGAYDAKAGKFLILDVDREWYTPYWVTQDNFFKGMASTDKGANKSRGYLVIEPKS